MPNYPASISLTLRNAGKLIILLFPPLHMLSSFFFSFFRTLARAIHMHTFDKLIIFGRLYSEKKNSLKQDESQQSGPENWELMQHAKSHT